MAFDPTLRTERAWVYLPTGQGATSVTFAPGKPSTSTSLSPEIYFVDKPALSSKTDPKTNKKYES